MKYLIGMDIGTSSVKAVLMSYDGKIADVKTQKHSYFFRDDMKLMDAEEFCDNCFYTISEIMKDLKNDDDVTAICISGAGGNLMFAKDGKSCSPVYGWQTEFDEKITELTLGGLTNDDVYNAVGWPKISGFPLAGLAYLKKTNPQLLNDSDKICMHIEYFNYKLTGNWGITRSMGTTFYLIDQKTGTYNKEYLDMLDIPESKLLPVLDNCSILGKITDYAASKCGLKEGTPVIIGTFDHPAAARGTGISKENDVVVSCGTSWVVFTPYKKRETPVSKGMLIEPYFIPECDWAGMKSLPSVSETIDALKAKFLGKVSYSEFDELADASPKGCNGLVINDETADVTGYSRCDIARAIIECIARQLNAFFEELDIKAESVNLVGGITNSKVWCKVVEETTGKKVKVINGEHAGAVGSAIMAGIGIGVYRDELDAFKKLNLN